MAGHLKIRGNSGRRAETLLLLKHRPLLLEQKWKTREYGGAHLLMPDVAYPGWCLYTEVKGFRTFEGERLSVNIRSELIALTD